jgi:hypothetical protein
MYHHILSFITLFLLMLVTGVFWGPWFALHRSLKVFQAEEFLHIVKTLAANLAVPMRILMPTCIFCLILSVWYYPDRGSLGFYLSLFACLLSLVSLLITVAKEVPYVAQFERWTATTLPSNWETIRDSWVKFHVFRTFASLASFACYVGSVLLLIC